MQRGYIKIWRKLEDSGLLQMHGTLALFMVMLMKAVYKPCRVGTAELDRGQLSAGVHQLGGWTKLSTQSVRTCLKHLHNMDIITSKSTNQYTIYTIVNYNEYQDIDTVPNKPLTNDQQTTNKRLTTEEDIKKESIKNKPMSEYSDGFIKFWDTWPSSKRKGGKSECFKVWKAKNLESISDEIINHVVYCKGNGIWKDPQFIEAPKVYINQAKWDGAEISEIKKPSNIEDFMKAHS